MSSDVPNMFCKDSAFSLTFAFSRLISVKPNFMIFSLITEVSPPSDRLSLDLVIKVSSTSIGLDLYSLMKRFLSSFLSSY